MTNYISQYNSFSGADFQFTFYLPVSLSSEKIKLVQKRISESLEFYSVFTSPSVDGKDANLTTEANKQFSAFKKLEHSLKKFENQQVPIELKSIQTFSFQVHTDIQPVRSLKFKYPKGYSVGQRLIAGSIICTVLEEHPFQEIMEFNSILNYLLATSDEQFETRSVLSTFFGVDESSSVVDEIPPMNVVITGSNEQGDIIDSTIYGLKLINDGSVISIQDMITEQTFSFVAQDIDLFRSRRRGERNPNKNILNIKTGNNILNNDLARARQKFKRGFSI